MIALAALLVPVSETTYTSYRVETPEGPVFVPFTTVHPRVAATPLVTLG